MKTVTEQYDDGYQGALFTAETAEKAWRLGALDTFLVPAVRQRLTSCPDLQYSCDTTHQLADDALRMSHTAADYGELRKNLFLDATQHGAEPPWRTAPWGPVAVRIRPRLYRCAQAALVLSHGVHEVPAWALAWKFTAIANPFDPKDEGVSHPVTLYRFSEGFEPAKEAYLIDAPPELEQHSEWYRQMFYGFLALGLKVCLGAVMHEDARRRIIEGSDTVDGLRPSTRQNHQTSLEDAACDRNVNGD